MSQTAFPPLRVTDPAAFGRVAVLMGGLSSEREVSLSSGRGCADALEGQVAKVTRVDAGRDLAQVLTALKPDVVFNALHGEWGEVTADAADAINRTRAAGGRVIPVGTTALRLIESAATPQGEVLPFSGVTEIFIYPGYRFRVTDALMTNFHLPKSTLLMLVSALMGQDRIQALYRHAVESGYRFFSYGDASLLIPKDSRC